MPYQVLYLTDANCYDTNSSDTFANKNWIKYVFKTLSKMLSSSRDFQLFKFNPD